MTPSKLVVISGPSGVGKTSLLADLRKDARVFWSVSATTRRIRPGERDGCDYHFIDEQEFVARCEQRGFLEYAKVHGNYYGTPREPIGQALATGKTPLLDIDVQGAVQVMQQQLSTLFIFIQPPEMAVLLERLEARQSDSAGTISLRMAQAEHEMTYREQYDYIVTNDDLDRARAELSEILHKEIGW